MSIESGDRVTLNGINRRGYENWKQRNWWNAQMVFIWSAEHHAFWRPDGAGYTEHLSAAGRYSFRAAFDRTKHCGPEKRIEYVTAAYARRLSK